MTALQAIRIGIKTVNRSKPIWFIFWASAVLFAAVVVLPISVLVSENLAHSLVADSLFQNVDPQWVVEFIGRSDHSWIAGLTPVAFIVAGLYLLVATFLAGGAITVLSGGPERGWNGPFRGSVGSLFWAGCGQHFWRLFRLAIVSLPFYALVFAISQGLIKLSGRILGDENMVERPDAIVTWCRTALFFAMLMLVNMIFDYAKIRLVVESSTKVWRAAFGSVRLVFRNFGRTSGAYLMVFGIGVAALAAYLAVSGLIPKTAGWGVAAVVVIQQLYVLSRFWVRLLFFAGQTQMYLGLKARPEPEEEALVPAMVVEPEPELEATVEAPVPEEPVQETPSQPPEIPQP